MIPVNAEELQRVKSLRKIIPVNLGYIQFKQFKEIQKNLAEVERMLKVLIKSLEKKLLNP